MLDECAIDGEMFDQQPFEDASQVRRGEEVASLIESVFGQARPIGNDAPAGDCPTQHQRRGSRTVVSAACPVNLCRAAEFGYDYNHGFRPERSELIA